MHRRLMFTVILMISAWAAPACGDDDGAATPDAAQPDAITNPCDEQPTTVPIPEIPQTIGISTHNTTADFSTWHLIGNGLTPGDDTLTFAVTPPQGSQCVDVWLDQIYQGRFDTAAAPSTLNLDISALEAGEHEVVLVLPDSPNAFAQRFFQRSHPYYVLVTNDWDDALHDQQALDLQQDLHDNHPELKMTHFVGPYTFTDPAVTAQEVADTVAWVVNMRDTYGDEIGLHVHPYCHFVEAAGLTCRTQPSFAYTEDTTGYTVVLGSYDGTESQALFAEAKALFAANGLGTPTSFRAGGWTVELHTLVALAAEGFVADTSAANWARMEEWQGAPDASLYEWNEQHWASIDEWSQPYYPSTTDVLDDTPPVVPILEVPDNGLLVDYVDTDEVIEMFEANWPDGNALPEPRTYVTGYHPGSYWAFTAYMEQGLDHIDQFLYAQDGGPVIYETLSPMALVWPAP